MTQIQNETQTYTTSNKCRLRIDSLKSATWAHKHKGRIVFCHFMHRVLEHTCYRYITFPFEKAIETEFNSTKWVYIHMFLPAFKSINSTVKCAIVLVKF